MHIFGSFWFQNLVGETSANIPRKWRSNNPGVVRTNQGWGTRMGWWVFLGASGMRRSNFQRIPTQTRSSGGRNTRIPRNTTQELRIRTMEITLFRIIWERLLTWATSNEWTQGQGRCLGLVELYPMGWRTSEGTYHTVISYDPRHSR